MRNTDEIWLGLPARRQPLVQAGILLGLGLGGFFDGIVFHQILQWHHMVSSHADPSIAGDMTLNVMADGFFHAATYLFTIIGLWLLVRVWRRQQVPFPGQTLLGSIILGWGIFNVGEGVINHHLLGIHHVWPDGPGSIIVWDIAFLIWGLIFIALGYSIIYTDDTETTPSRQPSTNATGEHASTDRVEQSRQESN